LRGTRASNHLAMNEIELREVAAHWMIDGSKNTLGILEAFKDHVERWTEERMTAADVDAFRFIGTVATDRWPTITGGTYRVSDAVDEPADVFEWRSEWALITVRDPENGERVILDGNNRALQLRLAVAAGRMVSETPITVITGDLFEGGVRFIARLLAPLWR
jgi:hypothetical protein